MTLYYDEHDDLGEAEKAWYENVIEGFVAPFGAKAVIPTMKATAAAVRDPVAVGNRALDKVSDAGDWLATKGKQLAQEAWSGLRWIPEKIGEFGQEHIVKPVVEAKKKEIVTGLVLAGGAALLLFMLTSDRSDR